MSKAPLHKDTGISPFSTDYTSSISESIAKAAFWMKTTVFPLHSFNLSLTISLCSLAMVSISRSLAIVWNYRSTSVFTSYKSI